MRREEDENWMRACFALAQKGTGAVSPNPLVGAIVILNGKIVGRGFHQKFGEPHAEANAIHDALRRHSSIQGATLYVNLEPCAHHGKTPPCVATIVRHGIKRVVAAIKDPNPRVAGRGFRFLRRAGVKVLTGTLAREAELLNEKFSSYITTGLPFVAIKAAQTADGYIARSDGSSKWITSKRSRVVAHRLRSEYDAVLVGAGTAIADNPKLTVRYINGRNPVRVLLDGRLRTPLTANLFRDRYRHRTIVFAGKTSAAKVKELRDNGVQVILAKEKKGIISVTDILSTLGKKGIASLLLEGGQAMYGQFLRARAVQKIYLFTSPKKFKRGVTAFGDLRTSFRIVGQTTRHIGRDRYVEGYVSYRKGR